MERCLVSDDFRVHCGAGLHVATLAYAQDYGNSESLIVIVKVNPADVVSVPEDYGCQKVRCCKYEVLSVFKEQFGYFSEIAMDLLTSVGIIVGVLVIAKICVRYDLVPNFFIKKQIVKR